MNFWAKPIASVNWKEDLCAGYLQKYTKKPVKQLNVAFEEENWQKWDGDTLLNVYPFTLLPFLRKHMYSKCY